MSAKTADSFWAPLSGAVDQASERAKNLNKQARKLAKRTADELRSRSEAAIQAAQQSSEQTLKLVRKNLTEAQKAIEGRIEGQTDQLTRLVESARRQLGPLENELRRGFERVARSLNLALEEDVESLRRKIATLEKRVGEIARENKAA